MATNQPENNFVVVSSKPMADDFAPENEIETVRRQYIQKVMEDLAEVDKPGNIEVQGVSYQADETGHPTIEGTREILRQLSNCSRHVPELVWHEEYATSERAYGGVEGIYKYGCNHCGSFGKHISHATYKNANLCDNCHEINRDRSMSESYPVLMGMIESVQQAKIDRMKKKRSVESIEAADFKREKLEVVEESVHSNISSDSDTINGDGH